MYVQGPHFLALAVACSVLAGVTALPHKAIPRADQGVVTLPLQKRTNDGLSARQVVSTGLINDWTKHLVSDLYYFINVVVGSEAEQYSLLFDTGSSDTWLYGPNFCQEQGLQCCKYPASRYDNMVAQHLEASIDKTLSHLTPEKSKFSVSAMISCHSSMNFELIFS